MEPIMIKRIHERSARQISAAQGVSLPFQERTELHRQGAKAAVRGDASAANPMEQPDNAPANTGENPQTWTQRRDAWQKGFAAQKTLSEPTANPQGEAGNGRK
jgi:hypothetical protein